MATELEQLRAELAELKANPYTEMYQGLLRQWNALAKELKEEAPIKISGDDKAFDRFAKFIEKLGPMTDNIEKLRKKVGIESDIVEVKKAKSPIEGKAK